MCHRSFAPRTNARWCSVKCRHKAEWQRFRALHPPKGRTLLTTEEKKKRIKARFAAWYKKHGPRRVPPRQRFCRGCGGVFTGRGRTEVGRRYCSLCHRLTRAERAKRHYHLHRTEHLAKCKQYAKAHADVIRLRVAAYNKRPDVRRRQGEQRPQRRAWEREQYPRTRFRKLYGYNPPPELLELMTVLRAFRQRSKITEVR